MLRSAILMTLLGAAAPALAQENEWSLRLEQFGSVNRADRDVDVTALTLSTPSGALKFGEYGLQGGFLTTEGRVTNNNGISYENADSNAVFIGGYARFAPADPAGQIQPFLEVGMAAVLTDRNLPAPLRPGDPAARFYGKFDARMGAEVAISERYAIEGAAILSHISNAHGQVPDNLNFDGAGFTLGIVGRW